MGLNLLLILRFVYPEWLAGVLVRVAFWVAVAAWVTYVVRSVRDLPWIIAPRTVSDQPDRFEEAQQAYLQSDWKRSEKLLLGVLAIEPRDPPALLMLAGVYRHTDRLTEAELLIGEIMRLEVADRWELEVAAERQRLDRDNQAKNSGQQTEESSDQQDNRAADLTAA